MLSALMFQPGTSALITVVLLAAVYFLWFPIGAPTDKLAPPRRPIGSSSAVLGVLVLFWIANLGLVASISRSPHLLLEAPRIRLTEPGWELRDMQTGNVVDFMQFRGKVVFVNFWATWCGYCIEEMPSIAHLNQRFKQSDDFAMVLISLDEDPQAVQRYLNTVRYSLPVYRMESNPPPAVQSIESLPTTLIVDKQGMIRIRHRGAADWNTPEVVDLIDELREAGDKSVGTDPQALQTNQSKL